MKLEKITRDFIRSLAEPQKKRTSAYDSKGIVTRVEEGIAWVKLAGSKIETPVQMTISAEPGDEVQARIGNGTAWLVGNGTSPPTDDTTANISYKAAKNADKRAAIAQNAAAEAYAFADAAQESAIAAQNSANAAARSASSATSYANIALDQLGIVEDVIGVLNMLAEHGEYSLTEDTTVIPSKWYFVRSGTSPNYTYEVIPNPSGNPHDQGWYELAGVDEAIRNYISSQLTVTDAGLWIKRPDSTNIQTKILLSSTEGVVLYGTTGQVIGKYGETAQIGDALGFHIDVGVWYDKTTDTAIAQGKTYYTRSGDASNYIYTPVENPVIADIGNYYQQMGSEIGFYQATNKVAYINNNQLYITQSVVLQQMDLGTPVNAGGLGQWSWKVHKNGQNPARNNLNLKWIG